jgi:hypothetical protein
MRKNAGSLWEHRLSPVHRQQVNGHLGPTAPECTVTDFSSNRKLIQQEREKREIQNRGKQRNQ